MPDKKTKLTKFWQELKRRKVTGVVVTYISVSVVIISLAPSLQSSLLLPEWFARIITIVLIIGFPIAIIFSWIFDVSSKGISVTESETKIEPTIETNKQVPEKSIIVLPFDNLSSDPEQEYFSDGLTEEIITDLSYIDDLLVISRSSAMTFKKTNKKITEVAADVNVRYVLEGSVRKSENNLKIVAQLIDAATDTHLWAEKYSGTLENIFDIQEKVSRSISDSLKIKLNAQEKEKINEKPIDNVVAYDLYKRANSEMMSFVKDKIDYGLSLLQKSFDLTGENALIYSGMAFAYFHYTNLGLEQEKNLNKSEEFIEKALKIDPDLAEAHFVYANILSLFKGQIREAILHFKKALQNKPDHPDTLLWLWWWYHLLGKTEAASEVRDRLLLVDPINGNITIGLDHFMRGRFKQALDPILEYYRLMPDSGMHQLWKTLVLLYNEKLTEAEKFLNDIIKEPAHNSMSELLLFLKYALKGDQEKLFSILTPEFVKFAQNDCQISWHMAAIFSFINEPDESLKWLENAINRGFINYPFLKDYDILMNNIRGDERFKKLLERAKHEWEIFEV